MIKKLLFVFIFVSLSSYIHGQTTLYYLGTGTPSDQQGTSCASCHTTNNIGQPIYQEWVQTAHATTQDSLQGMSFFGYNCLECHNTGWFTGVNNYGADEFVVQDTTKRPNYTITNASRWNKVKNVGCESCHGPVGNQDSTLAFKHWVDYKPDFSAEVCGDCHRDGHHPYMEEWEQSAHADGGLSKPFIVNNKSCVKCHVAQNFVAWMDNPETYKDTILVTGAAMKSITCTACHDPHSKKHEGQLRRPIVAGRTICDECHTVDIDTVDINTTPHHTTSEVLSGTNKFGYRYPGQTYINSAHTFAIPNRCVTCHVHREEYNETLGFAVTGHTFEPSVKSCIPCHPDYTSVVDTSNADKKFDYRGVQTQITNLLTQLQTKLKGASPADSQTVAFKAANYNYNAVVNEGSHGIHNTQLTRKLLQDALANFNPTSVEHEGGLPTSYSLSQNYPNPFNPSTSIKFSLPTASNVKITIYDALGNVVETLVNEHFGQGNYTVEFNGMNYSSGVYLYRIEAKDFKMTKKMVLIK